MRGEVGGRERLCKKGKKKNGGTEGKCQQDKHTSSLSPRMMVKGELAKRVRPVSSWVGKPVFVCWCFARKVQCKIVYPNHRIICIFCHVTFLWVKLASYYCVIAVRYWICNGTEADFLLEVRLIYVFLFKDAYVEADWYSPISYSTFSKINIKISLMRMFTMNLAEVLSDYFLPTDLNSKGWRDSH